MIKRWQESGVLTMLKYRRAVNLAGARQCGKTTLAMSLPLTSSKHFTLDDAKIAEVARNDPSGFVNRAAGETLIIDEIQKIPELLNYIKINVDRNGERGQYLFTGSANLHFVKVSRIRLRAGSAESGCGRFHLEKSTAQAPISSPPRSSGASRPESPDATSARR